MENTPKELNKLIENFNAVVTDIKIKFDSGFFNACDVNYVCSVMQPHMEKLIIAYKNAF